MALNFDFTEEQEKFRQEVREYALKELMPRSSYWDQHEEFPWDAVKEMAKMGLMGLVQPKRLGGQERSLVDLGIAVEELARGDMVCGFIVTIQNAWVMPPVNWGEDLVRDIVKGEKVIAIGSTEPGMGSDSTNPSTVARHEGDEYVINGVKRYISFVPAAYAMGTTCRTLPDSKGMHGISYIKVELDRPGVKVSAIGEFGIRAHQLGNIVLKDVRVPVTNLMAEEHRGMYAVFDRWGVMRILNTMSTLGTAQQALADTIEYVKRRKAFGRPIGKFEAVQFRIVEDYTNLEMARLMAYNGLWQADQGRLPNIREAAMVKSFGTVAAARCIDNCIQNHGALGYTTDLLLEQRYRDARAMQIGNGSLDIMKIMLGRILLGDECVPYR